MLQIIGKIKLFRINTVKEESDYGEVALSGKNAKSKSVLCSF